MFGCMFQNNIVPQMEPVRPTPAVEMPKKTCDEKRIEKLKFKYNKSKDILSHSEGHLQNVIYRMDISYQAQVKAEEDLLLAQIKYKKIKKESKNICRELRDMRNIVNQNKRRKGEALKLCNSAIKEKNMKIILEKFNVSQELDVLERSNVSLNLELLRSKIPDEVLNIIASYIPYTTRVEMIEHFHKPQNYLRSLSAARLNGLLHNMNYASYYCLTGMLASPEETKLLRCGENGSICETLRREESIVKIKFILMIFKKRDPKCALRVLKIFAILNQANITNKCKHPHTIFRLDFKQEMEFMTHTGSIGNQ